MDKQIKEILDEYVTNVNSVCHKLLEGINIEENVELKTKSDFLEYRNVVGKMEFNVNGINYRLHGRGCFAFSNTMFLNWNFGYRSRWCGIDPWMVGMTLKKNNSAYAEYYDGKLLKKACEQAVLEGEMFEQNGLYYYSMPINETFIPNFPKDYDTLIIEYFNDKWTILRNKVVDRFLRKSSWVYNKVYDNKEAYILRFFLNDKEVFTIPYDDICYPENAIKIMTDDIICNLKKNHSK